MNCDEVKDRLSEYLDGELSSPERSEIASHIERCPSCAWELKTIRKTVEILNSLPRFCAPPELAQELRMRIARSRLIFAKRLFALAGAAAVILIALLLIFPVFRERRAEHALSSVEKVAQEEEFPIAHRVEKLPATERAREELQKPHFDELANKAITGEGKQQAQEMKVVQVQPGKESAERGKIAALSDARLKKAVESRPFAGQGSESADKFAQAAMPAAEVVEKEIVIRTSDLKKDLDKVESLLVQVWPDGKVQQPKIEREVSEDGTITLVVDCATEKEQQQLVEKIGGLGTVLDSRAPAKGGAIAGGRGAKDLTEGEQSRELAKALNEEKAKSEGPEEKAARSPGQPEQEKQQKKPAEPAVLRAGEPPESESEQRGEGVAGGRAPEVEKARSAPQKQAESGDRKKAEGEKKAAPVRYVVRVKLVIVDTKK